MGADAENTISNLHRVRGEIFTPIVAAKRGRLIKSMGDGWIVTFTSVAEAVECAMQIQDQIKTDGIIQLRMGIHLGDVSEANEDVFGDGVNVASRLQALAEPGALVISDAARILLDGTLRLSFDDAGNQVLKNVEEPVRVWTRGGEIAGAEASLKPMGFPTLSIRPVEAGNQQTEIQELASALTGGLASILNAPRYIHARISNQKQTGGYVLTSKLRTSGDRFRLEASLTNSANQIIFHEKYDGDFDNVFDWQDDVNVALANSVVRNLIVAESESCRKIPEASRTAEQWLVISHSIDGLSLSTAREILNCSMCAIEANSNFGYAYAHGLAMVALISAVWGPQHYSDLDIPLEKWMEAADRLEPSHSPSRLQMAFFQLTRTGDAEKVKAALNTSLRVIPFNPEALQYAGWLNIYLGNAERALDCFHSIQKEVTNFGFEAGTPAGIGRAHLQLGSFEEAITYFDDALDLAPEFLTPLRGKISALAHLKHHAEAKKMLEKLPLDETLTKLKSQNSYVESEEISLYLEGLRIGGMPE